MHDFDVLMSNTPYVLATKKNYSIATFPGMPNIYHKDFDITEFIGEELAKVRGVNSVHYFPVLFDNIENCLNIDEFFDKASVIRVGSYDFKEKGVHYVIGCKLPFYEEFNAFDMLLDMCPSDKNREELLNEILECYGLDIFSGQMDRPANIYYEFHPNGEVHLSKIFDYEFSLDENFCDYYITDFHIFRTIDDYQKFMIFYPKLEEILRSYLDVDLEYVIKKIALSRKLDISGIDLDKYRRFNEITHKKLEKILR